MQKTINFRFWGRSIGNLQLLLAIFLLSFTTLSYGQVWTTVLKDQRLEEVIPNHSTKPVTNVKVMPPVDIAAVLRQDSIEGKIIVRYGVPISTSINKRDGEIEEKGNLIVWKTSVRSRGATSLNFHLSNLVLPQGSTMYIYNKAGTMVSGPVTKDHVYEGLYATDAINGEEVFLEIIVPKEAFEDFDIQINNVIHGFKDDVVTPRAYNDSDSCHIDVNCTVGWEDERDGVALIFTSIGGTCSGSLINNGCQDLRSFFLTAFHCVDGANVTNWSFRFNYDSPNPTIPNCRGSEPTSWLTYSGSTLRASHAASDFALLELTGSVIGQPTLALAGWDRNSAVPSSSTSIHHPNADVKKIAFDINSPVVDGYNITGTDHLRVSWDFGITARVSSGSPLFDGTSQRIIGQLHGGFSQCDTTTAPDWYGRFFTSWTGGGTNTTRLSDWLGGGGAPTTTNTIRSPHITVSGSGPICSSSSKTFTLNNLIPGRTATWTATPSSYFVTASGSGTSAVVQPNAWSSGLATITFTISAASGCNPITVVSKQFWVGLPSFTMTGSNYLCTNQPGAASLNGSGGTDFTTQGVTSVSWTYFGALQLFSASGQSAYYNGASSPGSGIIYANNVTNACGSVSPSMFFQVVSCLQSGDISMKVSPNPSRDFADIEINTESLGNDVKLENGDLTIYDKLGRAVLVTKFNGERQKINISALKPDIYFVEIVFENVRIREKILITH